MHVVRQISYSQNITFILKKASLTLGDILSLKFKFAKTFHQHHGNLTNYIFLATSNANAIPALSKLSGLLCLPISCSGDCPYRNNSLVNILLKNCMNYVQLLRENGSIPDFFFFPNAIWLVLIDNFKSKIYLKSKCKSQGIRMISSASGPS